jgi:hypothetical protein
MNEHLKTTLALLRADRQNIDRAINALESLDPDAGSVMETVARAKPPATPKKVKEKRATPEKAGAGLNLVRGVTAHRKGVFSAREVADAIAAKAGKPMHVACVRKHLALLVNTGEIKIAHEGTSKWDPTTWESTAKGKKGKEVA